MKQSKRFGIAEVIIRLGRAKSYSPSDMGVDMFRRTDTDERSTDMKCILVSTTLRDQIIKLLAERL
jgi:hypothetical protein